MPKSSLLVLAVICALSTQTASAQAWYPNDTVIANMSDADVDLFQKSTMDTLDNAKDGSLTEWNNPATGTHGIITPLKTYNANNSLCRLVSFENVAGDIPTKSTYSLCKAGDGIWELASSATPTKSSNGTEGPAEHCKELSRKIEALKGKPLQRSAATDRYNAECKQMPASPSPVISP